MFNLAERNKSTLDGVYADQSGESAPPKRYLNNYGQFLENSPYCERDLRPPRELVTHYEQGEF